MTTWMVVEDEPDLYDMVLTMYEMMGVQGKAFVSGEEAIDWIEDIESGRLHEEIPALALLDIRLPGDADGVEVGVKLRKTAQTKNMVIVLMTAFKLTPKQERDYIKKTNADLLLYKPLPPLTEFQRILQELKHTS